MVKTFSFFKNYLIVILASSPILSMEDPGKHRVTNFSETEQEENIFDIVKRERLTCFINDKTKKDIDELVDQQPDKTEDDESLKEYVNGHLEVQLNLIAIIKIEKNMRITQKIELLDQ